MRKDNLRKDNGINNLTFLDFMQLWNDTEANDDNYNGKGLIDRLPCNENQIGYIYYETSTSNMMQLCSLVRYFKKIRKINTKKQTKEIKHQ